MGEGIRNKLGEKNLALASALFMTGAALILFYMVLRNFATVRATLGMVVGVVSPFIYGGVIAYLLAPIFDFLTRRIYKALKGSIPNHRSWELKISKGISTVISLLILIAAVVSFGFLVIPQLVESISSLVEAIPDSVRRTIDWLESKGHDGWAGAMILWLENSTDSIVGWIRENFLPQLGDIASQVYAGVWGTLKTVLNILVGVITSAYLLNGREHFKGQLKKIAYAFLGKKRGEELIDLGRCTNRMFGGFISGKILDSIIIGIICFIAMALLNLPYAVLVSCIIGITNVIPFFGPFIGAVPGAFIIFVVDPVQALIFLAMILVLQQFDGNILGPKVLGDTTGLASFWVLFSIIIGGGLFGFIGMVLAVPTFAVFYYYMKRYVEGKLMLKELPVDTASYEHTDFYDPDKIKKKQKKKKE